nr:oligosaccharide flippase family protein [Variibacter gotjawalensis]
MSNESGRDGRTSLARAVAFARAWLTDASHSSLAQRAASTAFLIRLLSAAIAFLSQVLLARWMGSYEFGIYVYVWTWVLLIGGVADIGLSQSAQRFIPEYTSLQRLDALRGFLAGSRWIALGFSTAAAVVAALLVWKLTPLLHAYLVVPLFLACVCLPLFALGNVQEGISRSYDWLPLGMGAPYILRPALLFALMATAHALGLPENAESAMYAAVGATWITTILQLFVLQRRLDKKVPAGPKQYETRHWFATSLPILMVDGFYLLLTYTDILVLQQFQSPEKVAIYYAAAKTLALVAFVNFSVSAAVAHRFAEYHVLGDRERLSAFLSESIRWTFYPSLIATALILALGLPFLWLFGREFTSGYPLMFVLAIGLIARAAVGPVERLLNMSGEQKICAAVYATSFVVNLIGCLVLVPTLGVMGAAIATSFALVFESVLLFAVTKRRLGLHVFIWRRG